MANAAKNHTSAFTCLTVAILIAACFMPTCSAVTAEEANTAISQAEHDLNSAYVAVAAAETAEADISTLLTKLSSAGDYLSRAQAAYKSGNYENANALAVECSSTVEGVSEDAASLKADAEKMRSGTFLFTAIGSSAGLVLLLVFGLRGWRLLKKWYSRRILDMKPQLEEAT